MPTITEAIYAAMFVDGLTVDDLMEMEDLLDNIQKEDYDC